MSARAAASTPFEGIAVDFNRHGIAIVIDQPLRQAKKIFVSIECGGTALNDIVGVVHNCIVQDQGYRCGIQFRTRSTLQFDADEVEAKLIDLEAEVPSAIVSPRDQLTGLTPAISEWASPSSDISRRTQLSSSKNSSSETPNARPTSLSKHSSSISKAPSA